jgi:hypothetical protein
MNALKRFALAAALLVTLVGAMALFQPATSHGDSIKDTRVINTPAEAVPVSIQGTAGISGTIQAQQSGAWNVGINGTPTVRIDPLNNLVRTGGTKLLFNQSLINIPGTMEITPIDISEFSKIRVSVTVNGSGSITFLLLSGTNADFPGGYRLDEFTVSSGGGQLTRTYDTAGVSLRILLIPTNLDNNQAIIGVFGS